MHAHDRFAEVDRRRFLTEAAGGFGALAASCWLHSTSNAEEPGRPLAGLHHPAKAKRVIQLFMNGGASPMDTFDYKPALEP
jgi:hypothetical protein